MSLAIRGAVRFILITILMVIGYALLHILAAAPFLVAGL